MTTNRRTTRKPATETPETVETPELAVDYTTKEPSAANAAMAEWITKTSGVAVDAKAVQVITALARAYRKSDDGQAAIAARRADVDAKRAAATAAKRAAKLAAIAKLQAELDAEN